MIATREIGRQFRALHLDRSAIDEDARTVALSFSSEAPVERWWGVEILGHNAGEVDLSWVGSGRAPVLADHDTRSQIGVVIDARIGKDRRGRAVVRFGNSPRAEQEWSDVLAGVRTNVSVGYEILDMQPVNDTGDVKTFRATRWRPLEISLVSVPADMTVGVGRAANSSRGSNMNARINDLGHDDDAPQSRSERRAQHREREARQSVADLERERIEQIEYLAGRHQLRELGERAIASGMNIEQFRGQVLEHIGRRSGNHDPLYQPAAEIGMSQREAQSFSIARLLLSKLENRPQLAPMENEACEAVRQKLQRTGQQLQGGLSLPMEVLRTPIAGDMAMAMGFSQRMMQRDLSTATVGAGAAMVATDVLYTDFITMLRNRTLVLAMGARLIAGLVGNVSIPRQTGSVTINWVAQGGAAAESDATFAAVPMSIKTAHAIQDVTRDLLLQGTPGVEGIIRADLLAAMSIAIDSAALHGTGTSNQPTGLAVTAGIGSVAGGTNGAAPTWDNIVALETTVANVNGAESMAGYLTNSRVRGQLKRAQKFTGTNGVEVWGPTFPGDNPAAYGSLNGYRAGVSNNVRNDLTKGTSSGICSAIFFGDWSDLVIGQWGSVEILPDPYTQAATRVVRMHVYQSLDIAVRRPQSFAAMLDALTP